MTSRLYPLSNVMLVVSDDQQLLAEVARKMRSSAVVDNVSSASNWVCARTDLPGQPSVPFSGPQGCAWFAEGQPEAVDGAGVFVATAFDQPSGIARLGDAGFVALRGRQVAVVRSRRGLVPWYLLASKDCVVVSTRNAWFPLLLPFEFEPDPIAHIGACNDGVFADRRGLWVGTRILRTGHRWEGALGVPFQETGYWDPTAATPTRRSNAGQVAEVAQQIRDSLIGTLSADLDPDGRNLLGLSGGVDSSCLAALTTHQLKVPFMSLTLALRGDSPAHQKNQAYIDSIKSDTRPTRSWDVHYNQRESLELMGAALRVGLPVAHQSMQSLPRLNSEASIAVFVGGEMADDFLGGPQHLRFDWANAAGPAAFASAFRAPVRGIGRKELTQLCGRNLLRSLTRRSGPPGYLSSAGPVFASHLRDEFEEWKRRTEAQQFQFGHLYGAVRMALFERDGWLAQNWEVCSSLGIRRSVPFVAPGLVELACSLHPTDHAMPPKRVLRMGFGNDVPAFNLNRTSKGVGFDEDPSTVTVPVPTRLRSWLDPTLVNEKSQIQLSLDLAWYVCVVAAAIRPVA